jgi:hypothetical protein
VSDLRCDCRPDAQPQVEMIDESARWLGASPAREHFVLCPSCGYRSSFAMTREGAARFWTTLDRINDREEQVIPAYGKGRV